MTTLNITRKISKIGDSYYIRVAPEEMNYLGKPNFVKAIIIPKQEEVKNVWCPKCNKIVTINTDFDIFDCPFCDHNTLLKECKDANDIIMVDDKERQTQLKEFAK